MMEKALLGDIIFAHFSCKQKTILDGSNIEETIQKAIAEILKHIEEYVCMGSGWVISQLMHLDCHLVKYRPLKQLGLWRDYARIMWRLCKDYARIMWRLCGE
jgi:hypothetical protein